MKNNYYLRNVEGGCTYRDLFLSFCKENKLNFDHIWEDKKKVYYMASKQIYVSSPDSFIFNYEGYVSFERCYNAKTPKTNYWGEYI